MSWYGVGGDDISVQEGEESVVVLRINVSLREDQLDHLHSLSPANLMRNAIILKYMELVEALHTMLSESRTDH